MEKLQHERESDTTKEILQYERVSGTTEEKLSVLGDNSFNPISFELGEMLLLIMNTVPLLSQKYSSAEEYEETLKKTFTGTAETQELFEKYLWPMYEDIYNEIEKDGQSVYKATLSTVYNYIALCMANNKPWFYELDYFLIMASFEDSDYAPASLKTEQINLSAIPSKQSNEKTDCSKTEKTSVSVPTFTRPKLLTNPDNPFDIPVEYLYHEADCANLEYIFLNKDIYKPTYRYEIKHLLTICLATLHELISSRITIKVCGQCERWFIELSKNSKYCSDECKEAARKEKADLRLKDETVKLLKNRRQYYTNVQKLEELEEFNLMVKEMKKKIKEQVCTEDDLIAEIMKTYKRGPRSKK